MRTVLEAIVVLLLMNGHLGRGLAARDVAPQGGDWPRVGSGDSQCEWAEDEVQKNMQPQCGKVLCRVLGYILRN